VVEALPTLQAASRASIKRAERPYGDAGDVDRELGREPGNPRTDRTAAFSPPRGQDRNRRPRSGPAYSVGPRRLHSLSVGGKARYGGTDFWLDVYDALENAASGP